MTKEEAITLLCEHFSEGLVRTIVEALKQEQGEPVAYINVEQRKLEWAKYTSWETPTVANLPKIPLYIKPQPKQEQDEPVAWMSEDEHTVYTSKQVDGCFQHDHIPLYTTPQRTWVVLTDEEMRELEKQFEAERVRTSDEEYLVIYPAAYWQWQRAIEAKLKEKNT